MVNRHNYEEYFLLYADDELSNQQRAEVELFVQQNPDMAAELEIIRQMKLEPEDSIVFPDKSLLFKTADVEINIHNYETYFLLYVDKELDAATADRVEKFVLQHPQLQPAFTLLKQTVLQPEAITFGDKSVLYKKEERRVAYLGFARLAAAAAIIGLVVLGWWMYPKTALKVQSDNLAATKTLPKTTTPVVGAIGKGVGGAQAVEQVPKDAVAVTAKVKRGDGVKTQVLGTNVAQQQSVQPADETVKPVENNDMPTVSASTVNPSTTSISGIVEPVEIDKLVNNGDKGQGIGQTSPTEGGGSLTVSDRGGKSAENPFVVKPSAIPPPQTVAYKEIDTNEDDHSMYVGSLELNKDKIKGFFKRAGRIFGARPKKDTD